MTATGASPVTMSRVEVLAYRLGRQQLFRKVGTIADTAILNAGVQEHRDGARWALAMRGWDPGPLESANSLVTLWTLRGAPHVYRRSQLHAVLAAVAPVSSADAAKRIYDASKPLAAAGIDPMTALDTVAAAMRDIVTAPMVKGDVSHRLSEILPDAYLRFCRPCNAVHPYEMTFRLGATRAGLELQPGTSPPVLMPATSDESRDNAASAAAAGTLSGPGGGHREQPPDLDLIRGYLHLAGPATPKQVAIYLDSPVADIKRLWPDDAVEVDVDGERRWLLAADLATAPKRPPAGVRLLAPFDLYLQLRDRDLLVPQADRQKDLWRILGRPGAIVHGGDIAGTWRPRASGGSLQLAIDWRNPPTARARTQLTHEAEHLAAVRGLTYSGEVG